MGCGGQHRKYDLLTTKTDCAHVDSLIGGHIGGETTRVSSRGRSRRWIARHGGHLTVTEAEEASSSLRR